MSCLREASISLWCQWRSTFVGEFGVASLISKINVLKEPQSHVLQRRHRKEFPGLLHPVLPAPAGTAPCRILGSNLHDSGEGSVHCKSRSCSILTRSTSRMSDCEDKNLRDRAVALSGPLCIYTRLGKGNLDRSRQMLGREAEMAAASRRRGMLEANTSMSS